MTKDTTSPTEFVVKRIAAAVSSYREAPFRSADFTVGEIVTILDTMPANDAAAPPQAIEREVQEALRLFQRAAYPVATEINPRGYNWSEAYLDQALNAARSALATRSPIERSASEACAALPDHADILETIENAADGWKARGYASALADVGRALSHTYLDFYEEPLGMNATRDDVDRLARAAIAALGTRSPIGEREREQIARIVDPFAFYDAPVTDNPALLAIVERWKYEAYAKADAILALIAAYHDALARITALQKSEAAVIEQCAQVCEQMADDFLSPEYATDQPLSSFQERFACGQCANAIRSLTNSTDKGDGE